MQGKLKLAAQKTAGFFTSLDQSVYRVMVATFLCLLVYAFLFPVFQMRHIDYMLNAVFIIASLTKAATMHAAVERTISTGIGIAVGLLTFAFLSPLANYWVAAAGAITLVALIDYLYFGYYFNVGIVVCWSLLNGGDTFWSYGVSAYVVERVVTNAIGIAICLLVYMVWKPKTHKFAFRTQAGKFIEGLKAVAVAQLENKKEMDVRAELMQIQQLVGLRTVINEEASILLKGTRDTRMNRVLAELKAAVYNLNMLKAVAGELAADSKRLLEQALGKVEAVPPTGPDVERDDYAYNYHIRLVCDHLMKAERINSKVSQ